MTDDSVKTDTENVESPKVDHVSSMVNSLADGDNVAAQSAFKDALTDKIGQALDDKRMTVANDWLNAAQDTEAIKDAAGLDQVGIEPAAEPVELEDEDTGKENEQPAVSEVQKRTK